MSDDLSGPIQTAVHALLLADTGLSAIVGTRVFDRVPSDAQLPFVYTSGWQMIGDELDCYDVTEYFFDVQVFGRSGIGRLSITPAAGAVRKALHRQQITIEGGEIAWISHRTTFYFDEPDGLTRRAVLNFHVTSDQF
ncbi:DUF3168 domain-containing protein [Pseudochelatococcus sp. B33]